MSEKQYRDQIDRYTKELADLSGKQATANAAARKSRSAATTSRRKIKPTTSASMTHSHEGTADRHDKQAEGHEKKAAELANKTPIAPRNCTLPRQTLNANNGRQPAEKTWQRPRSGVMRSTTPERSLRYLAQSSAISTRSARYRPLAWRSCGFYI
ncbi:MAG: hypothetical protein ACR2JG_07660 [Geodermatophilaceae bacterium]